MSSNRRAFQAQLASQTPRRTQETPQEASQGGLEKFQFFQKKKWGRKREDNATYSPSPVAASRPRGTARRGLTVSYRYTTSHFFDHYGSCMTSSCAILGWDPRSGSVARVVSMGPSPFLLPLGPRKTPVCLGNGGVFGAGWPGPAGWGHGMASSRQLGWKYL